MSLEVWMVFEVVAPDREDLEGSLEDHLEKLSSEDRIELLDKELDEAKEVENPHPSLDSGFSQVAEVRLDVDGFDKALETVINYGPTYVQLEGPDNFEIGLAEGQNALQSVANTMHQYAQMGAGGVLISRADE